MTVANLRNDNGVLRCGLYAGADGPREPGREYRGIIAPIGEGSATCLFDTLLPGPYAVAAFHAEKNETQIEYGFFGQPKQGYGFSRNPDRAFDFTGGKLELAVKLSY